MSPSPALQRRIKPYPSDLTDDQWQLIAPYVASTTDPTPGGRGGRPLTYDRREIVDALRYLNRTGCQWRYLPHDFPPFDLVHLYFRTWVKDGTWTALMDALHEKVRALPPHDHDHDHDHDGGDGGGGGGGGGGEGAHPRPGRARRGQGRSPLPTAGVIDSQSMQAAPTVGRVTPEQVAAGQDVTRNRPNGVADSRSYDGGKKINGRKRHLLVDTEGWPIDVVITGAGVSDNAGGIQVLQAAVGREAGAHLELVWADQGYKKTFIEAAEQMGVAVEVVAKEPGQRGFAVAPRRWVVERTHAWVTGCRRLARDYERRADHARGQYVLAGIGVMLDRLAPRPGRRPWSPPVTA